MFRILSLTILHHKVLGELHLDFCKQKTSANVDNNIYSTVIIGENGIGKSYLLGAITEIFMYLESIKTETDDRKNTPLYRFQIKYYLHGNEYEFANFGRIGYPEYRNRMFHQYHFVKNGQEIGVNEIELPTRVIASTMTVVDKFNAKSKGCYHYKGIRSEKSPSTTGTRTVIRKTVTSLMNSLDLKVGFKDELIDLLKYLNLKPQIRVQYTFRYKQLFLDPQITPERLRYIYDNQEEFFQRRRSDVWGTSNFQKIRDDEVKLNIICRFLSRKALDEDVRQNGLTYEILEDGWRILEDRQAIELLSMLDLLSFPSLRVNKEDQPYNFEDSSSGETHLLCQFIGIMSDIEHNSLVLIDEPENSAHPNWQINYIGWLKHIFHAYSDCHFVLATHSHFILTDLRPTESDIIALDRSKDGRLEDIARDINTFCWSVDDILYRVFHVRNTRNEVFERQMFRLYRLLEHRNQHREEIRDLYAELSQYVLNADDPLNNLLKMAQDA